MKKERKDREGDERFYEMDSWDIKKKSDSEPKEEDKQQDGKSKSLQDKDLQ